MEEKGKVTCTLTGGIGHMLFQLAHCLTYAKEHDMTACAPLSQLSSVVRKKFHLDEYFLDDAGIEFTDRFFPTLYTGEKYISIGNVRLVGNVQGEEWFDSGLQWLRALRQPKLEKSVGIHIRGGDVYRSGDYTLLSNDIRETLRGLSYPHEKLYVFSDDKNLAAARLQSLLSELSYFFSNVEWHCDGTEEARIDDLFLMSQMEQLICSPSCFSWWGAWLGGGTEVYWPDTSSRGTVRRYMNDLKLSQWKWVKEDKVYRITPGLETCELLVVIQSCRKYRERRDTCRTSWLTHCPDDVKYFFAIGGNGAGTDILMEEPDVVELPCSDSYFCLHYKTREMFRYALTHYNFDYLFKCDDDTYVVLDRAQKAGRGVEFLSDVFSTATGGGGYFLSRKCVESLVFALGSGDMPYSPEDTLVSETMKKLGVVKEGTHRISRHCTHFIPTSRNDDISTHYIYEREADMLEHLLYSPSLYAYCWIDECTQKEEDVRVLYLYRSNGEMRFCINGRAKWNGVAVVTPRGTLRLTVDKKGQEKEWELEHTRNGYWEGVDCSGEFSIITPLNPKDVEELSLANS